MRVVSSLVAVLLLVGCSALSNQQSVPVGMYNGTSAAGDSVTAFVLSNGVFWYLYSSPTNSSVSTSIYEGLGQFSNGSFTSTAAYSYAVSQGTGATLGALTDTYVNGSLSGLFQSTSLSSTTVLQFSSSSGTPTISPLVGSYTASLSSSDVGLNTTSLLETLSIKIAANGAITGTLTAPGNLSCTVTGTMTPRTDTNAFDLSITFSTTTGVSPPFDNGNIYNGIAFYNATTRTLRFAAVTSDSTKAIGFGAVGPN